MARTSAKKRDPKASLALLWGEQDQPRRGPKPSLSLERIVASAIEIADAEGLDAVSLQRVAATFDVSTMALYHYIPGKPELVALMVDSAGPPEGLAVNGDGWRAQLTEWARQCWALYRQHPWILAATTSRRQVMGPNQLGWLDRALSAMSDTGLTATQQHDVFVLIVGYIRNLAQQLMDYDEQGDREWTQLTADLLERHADRFPALTAAIAGGAFERGDADPLDFGLERILDGVTTLIDRQQLLQRR